MITAERNNIRPVKVLISNSLVHLELFEDSGKNLFLSSTAIEPAGMVYFATTSSLLCLFEEGSITLQALFDRTPSFFVEITGKDKTALYSLNDIDIELRCGNKTMKELEKAELREGGIDFTLRGFMKKVIVIVCLAFIGIGAYAFVANKHATCTGSDTCKACKNCKYCKHCSKDGGKCGICK